MSVFGIKKPSILLFAILAPFLAGAIGSIFTIGSVDTWYLTLQRPSFTPPSWVFGPAWTTLYILMGIALYRVWIKTKKPLQNTSIRVFGVHLIVNAAWSIVFFGFQNTGLALFIIIALLAMIIYLTKTFYNVDKKAGLLLLPYLAWVSFATTLNYSFWILN